ncbi:unnamed protein product [Amoebophrya sp. A25]|nr:unnamed protein product [Amoebophrya sp. A25]|eukprot:GSA25T00015054001.1
MDAREEAQARQAAQMQAGQEAQMQEMQAEKQKQEQAQNQKKMIIRQLLEPEALERLQRIALVKKEKEEVIESAIIMKVQKGEITTKLDDASLVRMIVIPFAMRISRKLVYLHPKRVQSYLPSRLLARHLSTT